MKTLQELYNEVLGSDELKKSLAEAISGNKIEDFLKTHGCNEGKDEFIAFAAEQQAKSGELSDDALDAVAGGANDAEMMLSIWTLGIGCAVMAIESAKENDRRGEDGRLLCG